MDAKTIAGAGMIIGGGVLGYRSMKELSGLGCYGPAGYLTLGLTAIGGGLFLFGKLRGEAIGEATQEMKDEIAGVMGAEVEYMGVPVIANSYGEESALKSGDGVPQWYGSAETFEASGYGGTGPRTVMTTADGTRKYIRRNKKGQFTPYQVNIAGKKGSASIDRRMNARNYAKSGHRDQGDANPVGMIDRASRSIENAIDSVFGSETIETQMEPVIPNSYGDNSALSSSNGVPQWYGSAEQGYNDRDDESIGMRHRGHHKQSLKSRRDESKGMTGSMNHHHPYSDVGTMMAETEMGLPVVPNSFGEESTVVDSGHGVPQWIGSAEFEAQPRTRMTTAGGTRKYVRRNNKGQFTTYQVNVDGKKGAAAIDRRMKAKNYAKPGYRNEGDAIPVRQGDNKRQGRGVNTDVAKSAEARTRMTLQDGTRRYVRRNKKGQFTNYQVNVDGKKGAIANDRRQKAKNYAKPGFRNEGDAKATRQGDRR